MKRNKRFTLIELLTVIAIIGILAGILLPALAQVRKKAKKTKARADLAALKVAVSTYQQTYGILPSASTIGDLINCLGTTGGNPRGIIFLETHTGGTFADPWDNDYNFGLDSDYDGEVDTLSGVMGSSAFWSNGPDGTNNSGSGDDVTSWEE